MTSRLIMDAVRAPHVDEDVPYAVLPPPDWTADERLPLVLVLHGANSSRDVLAMLEPIADGLWGDGSLHRCVLATASTPTVGGFYLDRWESFVAGAFRELLEKRYGTDPEHAALMGASMGGYGALKIAFAEPERWEAVAAVAPALLPAATPARLRPRNTMNVLAQLGTEMAGDGTDERRYAANSVVARLRANAGAVRASGLAISLRCGDRDVFNLHDGTEQLHRALWDLDIGHEYHLVLGADHIGPEALASQRAALAFLGAAHRTRTGRDRTPADREMEAAWHEWAAAGRQGAPPRLDAFGVTGPAALRVMMEPELAETARLDPTAARRYGVIPPE
jgi:S-formylglutathione hydrolase